MFLNLMFLNQINLSGYQLLGKCLDIEKFIIKSGDSDFVKRNEKCF